MRKQQLLVLCFCNFILFMGISSLIGLLPVYLTQLGADSSATGFFMAALSLSLALSNVVAGQLSDRIQRRKPFLIIGGALSAPLTWLLAGVTSVPLLLLLMLCLWFVSGIAVTMVSILMGLFSEPGERGRLFGLLSLSVGLGIFVGSLLNGRIVDRWGYDALFTLTSLAYLAIPAAGLLLKDKVIVPSVHAERSSGIRLVFSNRSFLYLFIACVVGQAANSLIFLSRPLMMDALAFDATSITTAAAFGSLITLPLPLIIGWLADRVGRKQLIVVCFFGATVGLLFLAAAVDFWHFWAVSALATVLGLSTIVGSAIATDIFPSERLGTSIALMNVTPWVGIVIGFGIGGVALSAFQAIPTLLAGALLSIAAVLLLIPVSVRKTPMPQETI